MNFGIMGKAVIAASSNIPMPFFQYLCTLDWRAVLIFVVMFIVSGLIWYPFIKVYDNKCLDEENNLQAE